jgi:hypothetical protein
MKWSSIEFHWKKIAERLKPRSTKIDRPEVAVAHEHAPHLDAKLLRAYGLECDDAAKSAEDYCNDR